VFFVVIAVSSLWFKYWQKYRNIVLYSFDVNQRVYIKGTPMYGIPLIDYAILYDLLEQGDTQRVKNVLNLFIDQAVLEADQRLNSLRQTDAQMADEIEKALVLVARQRERYPRMIDPYFTGFANILQTRPIQTKADKVLLKFCR